MNPVIKKAIFWSVSILIVATVIGFVAYGIYEALAFLGIIGAHAISIFKPNTVPESRTAPIETPAEDGSIQKKVVITEVTHKDTPIGVESKTIETVISLNTIPEKDETAPKETINSFTSFFDPASYPEKPDNSKPKIIEIVKVTPAGESHE